MRQAFGSLLGLTAGDHDADLPLVHAPHLVNQGGIAGLEMRLDADPERGSAPPSPLAMPQSPRELGIGIVVGSPDTSPLSMSPDPGMLLGAGHDYSSDGESSDGESAAGYYDEYEAPPGAQQGVGFRLRLPGHPFSEERAGYVQSQLLNYVGDNIHVMTVFGDQVLIACEGSGIFGFLAMLLHVVQAHRHTEALADYIDELHRAVPWYVRTCIETTMGGVIYDPAALADVMDEQRDLSRTLIDALPPARADDDPSAGLDPDNPEARLLKRIIASRARASTRSPEAGEAGEGSVSPYGRTADTIRRRGQPPDRASPADTGLVAVSVEDDAALGADVGPPPGGHLMVVPVEMYYLYRLFTACNSVRNVLLALPSPPLRRALCAGVAEAAGPDVDTDVCVQAVVGTAAQFDALRTRLVDYLYDFVGDWHEHSDVGATACTAAQGALAARLVQAVGPLLDELHDAQAALFTRGAAVGDDAHIAAGGGGPKQYGPVQQAAVDAGVIGTANNVESGHGGPSATATQRTSAQDALRAYASAPPAAALADRSAPGATGAGAPAGPADAVAATATAPRVGSGVRPV
jgi:hypothetical protein